MPLYPLPRAEATVAVVSTRRSIFTRAAEAAGPRDGGPDRNVVTAIMAAMPTIVFIGEGIGRWAGPRIEWPCLPKMRPSLTPPHLPPPRDAGPDIVCIVSASKGRDPGAAPVLTLMPDRLGLPRGRAALPGSEVAASQRGRVLQAVIEEVATRGYAATTVQHVISRARVSRSAFYDQFVDKQDAFAHAHSEASRQLLDFIRHQVSDSGDVDWRRRMRVGVEAYLAGFESAPSYAVSFMVELRAAGPRLLDQRDQVLEQHAHNFARLAEAAAAADPRVRRPRDLEVIGVIGGADELATRAIRATAPDQVLQLKHLVDPIVAIYESVLLVGR